MDGTQVFCKCNEPAKYIQVQADSSPNKGRFFFGCEKTKDQSCGFFQWADGLPNLGPQKNSFGKFPKAKQNNQQPYGNKQSNWVPPTPKPVAQLSHNGYGNSAPPNVSPQSCAPASPVRNAEERSDREVALYLLAEKLERVEQQTQETLTAVQNKLNTIVDLLANMQGAEQVVDETVLQ